ncbi:MAG: hypothetical protein E6K81_05300 [Candidatus Eisenbacteria bacterium]|uniref:Uncharacterized protein n=1 Tax=Eiseniibacteriota bacterium TaxID=2212470 RepID=A0A538UBJ8_UNCEI|nr:MAG: hypothetical protein E6K81_05300 [Candidatus Eisenbacteria bacterium]
MSGGVRSPGAAWRQVAPRIDPHELADLGPLEWRRPHRLRREWVLGAGGRQAAWLTVTGTLREQIRLEGPSGEWAIRKRWNGALELSRTGATGPTACYAPNVWSGGVITTASGQRYEWTRTRWWATEWAIATSSGFQCMTFRPRRGVGRREPVVEILASGRRLPELEVLVLLGSCLLLRAYPRAQ